MKVEARVSHLSLSDKAYNLIKEKLISCDEGEYLSIREMSEQIGMSYTPVREAFQRLAKEGLLEQVPKLGFFVRRIDIRRISEIFQVRECLELFVLERVFDKLTPNDLETLSSYVDGQTEQLAKGDIRQYITLDEQFHLLPFQLYGNSYLTRLIQNVRQEYLICSIKIATCKSHEAIEEHRQMIAHMRSKDKAATLETLRSHIRNAEERMKAGYISL